MMREKKIFAEIFISTVCIKIVYDYLILHCLPNIYIDNVTYGVDFSSRKIFVGYLVFVIVSLLSIFLVLKKKNNVSLGLIILLDLYYVPMSSAYYLNNTSFSFLFFSSLFFVLLPSLNYFCFKYSRCFTEHKNDCINDKLFIYLCIIVSILCILYAYFYNGLNLSLDINSVYDVRADFVGSTNALTSILFHFGAQIVTVGCLYFLIKKKVVLFGLCLFAQLCIFSIARQKSDLLIILIVLLIWAISKLNMLQIFKRHLSLLLCFAMICSFLEFSVFDSTVLFGLFVRRMMYFPSLLNYYYFDYFSNNTLVYFTQDVFLINRLGIGIYNVPVITLINQSYFAGHVPSPNTGLFAEAFMHFGFCGVIIFPFIIIALSKVYSSFISYFSKEIQFLLIIQFFLTIMNIPMTGGVFVVTFFTWIPVMFFLKKNNKKKCISLYNSIKLINRR